MHTFLSVNQGGAEPAKLIILEYIPESADATRCRPCGKGITFDTGGISLKPSLNMDKMKGDMGGAAAVMGAMQAVCPVANSGSGHRANAGDGEYARCIGDKTR